MAKGNSAVIQQRHERWQEILRRWQASGSSQAAFCRRHGIPVWKMAWWRKRLGSGRTAPSAASAPFVPVGIVPAAVRLDRFELVLTGGRRLRFPAELDPARLTAIVAALETVVSGPAEGSTC
jgi:hypothetical protein